MTRETSLRKIRSCMQDRTVEGAEDQDFELAREKKNQNRSRGKSGGKMAMNLDSRWRNLFIRFLLIQVKFKKSNRDAVSHDTT